MRRLRSGAAALFFLGLTATSSPAQANKTLDECIAIALALQPSLKASTATVDAARERVWESASAYLPQVSAGYNYNRSFTNPGSATGTPASGASRTFNFYNTGFALSQVLFDFGQNLALIHASEAQAASAEYDAVTQRDNVIFNVRQAYFALLAAYRLRDVADETLKQNREHLELAEGRFHAGLAARFDVTQARVQVATAQLNLVTARSNVELGRETLRNTLGLNGPLEFDIVDVLDQPPVPIDEAVVLPLAYDHRPELRSLRSQEKAQQEQIAALETDYLPKVTSNSFYDWSGTDYPLRDTWNVGISVNIALFNGGLTTAQVKENEALLRNLRANEDLLRQNITLEVRQSAVSVNEAVESIQVADEGLVEARENLDQALGRYKTGVGTIIELTDAQTSLVSAEANRIQALANYRTALASLERAVATPIPLA